MKIYTRKGDDGTTGLVGGLRIRKNDPRLDAYGTIDELNSFIGLMLSVLEVAAESRENIIWVQQKLFNIGGFLATDTKTTTLPEACHILDSDVEKLEHLIDAAGKNLPSQRTFILPGGTQSAAYAHVARTVCRRAERLIVSLDNEIVIPSALLSFINRLSDYLFFLARRINYLSGIVEKSW